MNGMHPSLSCIQVCAVSKRPMQCLQGGLGMMLSAWVPCPASPPLLESQGAPCCWQECWQSDGLHRACDGLDIRGGFLLCCPSHSIITRHCSNSSTMSTFRVAELHLETAQILRQAQSTLL